MCQSFFLPIWLPLPFRLDLLAQPVYSFLLVAVHATAGGDAVGVELTATAIFVFLDVAAISAACVATTLCLDYESIILHLVRHSIATHVACIGGHRPDLQRLGQQASAV